MNSLLDFAGLPRFDAIQPTDVQPAISQLLAESRAEVERLLTNDVPTTWDSFAQPLQDNLERLSRAWGIVGHLHSVNDIPSGGRLITPCCRGHHVLPVSARTWRSSLYQALAASAEFETLSPARQRIILNEVRDFAIGRRTT
jgi:oligopeptidase A